MLARAVPSPRLPSTLKNHECTSGQAQMPTYVWENADTLLSLSYTSTVFTSPVCVRSVQALHMGGVASAVFISTDTHTQTNAKRKKKKLRKIKSPFVTGAA